MGYAYGRGGGIVADHDKDPQHEEASTLVIQRIVVIGGGYAGCIAANRLCRKTSSDQVSITLINCRASFVERVRLHQRVAGTHDASTGLSETLHPRVRLLVGAVAAIGDGELVLNGSVIVDFDWLIYAAGGAPTSPEGTYAVGDPEQAALAHRELRALDAGAGVTVVGGGLTGIETAAEIAEKWSTVNVTLLSDRDIGGSLHPTAAERIREHLESLGVRVERGSYTPSGHGARSERHLSETSGSGLVLWAIASGVSSLAARSGLSVDSMGRMQVDECLRSIDDQRIFGAGDCASVPGQRLSCQTALPQGAHVADTLSRILVGKAPKPYSMGYTGQNISLGRRGALVQIVARDDTARRLWVRGRIAVVVKEQVCRAAKGAAATGRYHWLPGPR